LCAQGCIYCKIPPPPSEPTLWGYISQCHKGEGIKKIKKKVENVEEKERKDER
jgi:hypothetical protein